MFYDRSNDDNFHYDDHHHDHEEMKMMGVMTLNINNDYDYNGNNDYDYSGNDTTYLMVFGGSSVTAGAYKRNHLTLLS